jgi:hypothetical protein
VDRRAPLALLLGVLRLRPQVPVALLVVLAASAVGLAAGTTAPSDSAGLDLHLPPVALPEDWRAVRQMLERITRLRTH